METKSALLADSQREILLALPLVVMGFLHMATAFRRNPDIWQAITGKKYKKHSILS
jgi:hypothetical protein